MNSAVADRVAPESRLISPANAGLTVCFLVGFGASVHLLGANHIAAATVGWDTTGAAKSVFYAMLGLTAGAAVSAKARLLDIRDLFPLYLLFMALVCIAVGDGAALAEGIGRLAANVLGNGSLAVSFLEHVVALLLGFPYFMLLGLAMHRFVRLAGMQAGRHGEFGLLPSLAALGAVSGGLVFWLAPVPAGFYSIVAMACHLGASLACLFCLEEDGSPSNCGQKTESKPEPNARKPAAGFFAVGVLTAFLVGILYWMFRLLLGPLDAASGLFVAALFGGLGCGIWLAAKYGRDSGLSSAAAPYALLAASLLFLLLIFEPVLLLREETVAWIGYRGHEFHAPFFKVFAVVSALLLTFPVSTALGLVLAETGAGEKPASAVMRTPVAFPALVGGGATLGALLAGSSAPALLGVKPVLFVAIAVSVWIHSFNRLGVSGVASAMRKHVYALCLAAIALFAALLPLYGIAYSVLACTAGVGSAMAILASSSQGHGKGNSMRGIRRLFPEMLCVALVLLAAFSGPINQARYIVDSTSFAGDPLSGQSDSVFFGSQGVRENVQIVSRKNRIELQLFINGLERDYYQRFGVVHHLEEPTILAGTLPAVYVQDSEKMALSGINLGSTARTLLSLDRVSQLDIVVRNTRIISALRHVFGHVPPATAVTEKEVEMDRAFLDDERLNLIFESPRAFFSVRPPETYDAVVSTAADLADPLDSPEFSMAHYHRISSALRKGGVFVQHFRTKKVSEERLSLAMEAISEAFGEYALYSSHNDLIVVAAKHGFPLPTPSGTVLRENGESLPVQVGFRDLQHVFVHRLGTKEHFDKYFRSVSRAALRVPSGRATGDLFGGEEMDLARSFSELDFPLSSVLEGSDPPELEIAEKPRRFTWEGFKYAYALSLYDHIIEGKWEAERFRQHDLSRLQRILESADCPAEEEEWLESLRDLRIATRMMNPYLSQSRMRRFWDRIDDGCLGNIPDKGIATIVDYYRALGKRDYDSMLRNGTAILESGGIETSTGTGILASMLVAHLMEDDRIEAMELFTRYALLVELPDSRIIRFIGSLVFGGNRQEDLPIHGHADA